MDKFDYQELVSAAHDLGYHHIIPDITRRLRDAFRADPSGNQASRVMASARRLAIKMGR